MRLRLEKITAIKGIVLKREAAYSGSGRQALLIGGGVHLEV